MSFEDGIYPAMFTVVIVLLFSLCDIFFNVFTGERNGNEPPGSPGNEVVVKTTDEEKGESGNTKDNSKSRMIWIVCGFFGLTFASALVFAQYFVTRVLSW